MKKRFSVNLNRVILRIPMLDLVEHMHINLKGEKVQEKDGENSISNK